MNGKVCSTCQEWKDYSEYQKRAASKDGYTASCGGCLSLRDKARNSEPHRVKMREVYSKGKGRGKSDAAKQRYIERNPKKRSAHIAISNAIRDGHITKTSCEECGSADVHAHHDDYNEPLKVRFLCPKHHQKWHDQHGEGLNPD